jgi:hypothetical protein
VAHECCDGSQEERKMVNVDQFEQVLPKDDFPITRIDKIIDSITCCEMMALLDYSHAIIKSGFKRKMRKRRAS